jgi:hypothetical protein
VGRQICCTDGYSIADRTQDGTHAPAKDSRNITLPAGEDMATRFAGSSRLWKDGLGLVAPGAVGLGARAADAVEEAALVHVVPRDHCSAASLRDPIRVRKMLLDVEPSIASCSTARGDS